MDDAADADPLPPAMMAAVAAMDRDDLSEEEQDKFLEAALSEALDVSSEPSPTGDHPKPSGPATDALKRMEAEIAAGQKQPKSKPKRNSRQT